MQIQSLVAPLKIPENLFRKKVECPVDMMAVDQLRLQNTKTIVADRPSVNNVVYQVPEFHDIPLNLVPNSKALLDSLL